MRVVRFADAPTYTAPGHDGMRMVRLQGREAGETDTVWLGVSVVEPGGGTTLDTSGVEKLYVVLDGTLDLSNGEDSAELHRWDSCRIAPGEPRRLRNGTEAPATVLLVMPLAAARSP